MKLQDVTVNNLNEVPATQAFEWVKTGAWNKVTFLLWVDDVKQESYVAGRCDEATENCGDDA
jgi:hypothetical protein